MKRGVVHIVDDDRAVRDAVRLLLSTEGFSAQSHVSAPAFLDAVQSGSTGCIVADVRMPEMSGLDLIDEVKARNLPLPIIIITGHGDIPLAVEAMKRGAIDFLEKPFDNETLIELVERGLSHGHIAQLRHTEEKEAAKRILTLTKREREILEKLAEGRSNKVIAHELGISVRTAEVHRANVMTKMRARNLAELVRMALAGAREINPTGTE